jgi:hypothetical protein
MVFITRPQAAVAAERMRLTSAGFFGIGTTAPGAPLVVQKGNDNAGDNALRIQSTSSTEFGFFEPNAASDYLRMGYYNGASFANVFLEGSVGINTSSPDAKLDVESAQDTEHIRFTDSTNADSVGLYSGQGTPIGTVTAQLGSMYFDSTGGKVYIKAVGDSTNTGWQEIQTGSGSLQMARMNKTVGTQNIYGGQVRQKVYLDAISFDVGGIANVVSGTTGSGRITIKKAGKYLVTSSWQIGSNCAASDRVDTAIYKNNSLVELSEQQCSTQIVESPVTQIFDLAVNDYLEMFVGIGTANTTSTGLHASPYLSVVQLNVSPGADIAELYGSYDKLNPGDVVVLDPARHSMVKKSTSAYESGLVGIISTAPGMVLGGDYTPPQGAKTVVLGLAGRVPVKVTTENGRILPGDLLTSSSKPGFAMKATGPGPVVGQALEGFNGVEAQEGLIMAFINNSRIGPAGLGTGSGTLALSASGTQMMIHDTVQQLIGSGALVESVGSEIGRQIAALHLEDVISSKVQALIDARLATGATIVQEHAAAFSIPENLELSGSLIVNENLTAHQGRFTGDLYVDGVLSVQQLNVPQGIQVNGVLTAAGMNLESGSVLSAHDIIVRNALHVIGPVTIDGLAEFFGDVDIHGELRISTKQAGEALLPAGARSVTVTFGSGGFLTVPVVTATSDDFTPWRLAYRTQTGFVIEVKDVSERDILFTWLALPTTFGSPTLTASVIDDEEQPPIVESGATLLPFPVGPATRR